MAVEEEVNHQAGKPSLLDNVSHALSSTARSIEDSIEKAKEPDPKPKPMPRPQPSSRGGGCSGDGWVKHGDLDYYQVTPTYSGRRTVPTGFRISAYGTFEDGTPGLNIDGIFISNTLAGRNLGTFSDPNTGRQVPTGSMP